MTESKYSRVGIKRVTKPCFLPEQKMKSAACGSDSRIKPAETTTPILQTPHSSLAYSMSMKMTESLNEALKQAKLQGISPRIKFGATSENNVIEIGERSFKFTSNSDAYGLCDCYEKKKEDSNSFQSEILVHSSFIARKLSVQRPLDNKESEKWKKRSEALEKTHKTRQVKFLDLNGKTDSRAQNFQQRKRIEESKTFPIKHQSNTNLIQKTGPVNFFMPARNVSILPRSTSAAIRNVSAPEKNVSTPSRTVSAPVQNVASASSKESLFYEPKTPSLASKNIFATPRNPESKSSVEFIRASSDSRVSTFDPNKEIHVVKSIQKSNKPAENSTPKGNNKPQNFGIQSNSKVLGMNSDKKVDENVGKVSFVDLDSFEQIDCSIFEMAKMESGKETITGNKQNKNRQLYNNPQLQNVLMVLLDNNCNGITLQGIYDSIGKQWSRTMIKENLKKVSFSRKGVYYINKHCKEKMVKSGIAPSTNSSIVINNENNKSNEAVEVEKMSEKVKKELEKEKEEIAKQKCNRSDNGNEVDKRFPGCSNKNLINQSRKEMHQALEAGGNVAHQSRNRSAHANARVHNSNDCSKDSNITTKSYNHNNENNNNKKNKNENRTSNSIQVERKIEDKEVKRGNQARLVVDINLANSNKDVNVVKYENDVKPATLAPCNAITRNGVYLHEGKELKCRVPASVANGPDSNDNANSDLGDTNKKVGKTIGMDGCVKEDEGNKRKRKMKPESMNDYGDYEEKGGKRKRIRKKSKEEIVANNIIRANNHEIMATRKKVNNGSADETEEGNGESEKEEDEKRTGMHLQSYHDEDGDKIVNESNEEMECDDMEKDTCDDVSNDDENDDDVDIDGELHYFSRYEKKQARMYNDIQSSKMFEKYKSEFDEKYAVYLRLYNDLQEAKKYFGGLFRETKIEKKEKRKKQLLFKMGFQFYCSMPKFQRMKAVFLILHQELADIKCRLNEYAMGWNK